MATRPQWCHVSMAMVNPIPMTTNHIPVPNHTTSHMRSHTPTPHIPGTLADPRAASIYRHTPASHMSVQGSHRTGLSTRSKPAQCLLSQPDRHHTHTTMSHQPRSLTRRSPCPHSVPLHPLSQRMLPRHPRALSRRTTHLSVPPLLTPPSSDTRPTSPATTLASQRSMTWTKNSQTTQTGWSNIMTVDLSGGPNVFSDKLHFQCCMLKTFNLSLNTDQISELGFRSQFWYSFAKSLV